ncbi:MAG: 3-hydroxyacyl-CoA dehydrogenase NAD-binding domain-containing protein, partial [Flavihumibacter sp.]
MFQQIAVIGAGTMGNGIAHVFAQYGFTVHLVDTSETQLEKAVKTIAANAERQVVKEIISAGQKAELLSRISTFSDISAAVAGADLCVEAVSEKFGIKEQLFKLLDAHAPAHCVLASNTSSISITRIAAATGRPGKVIGMHFMNPVPVMKLVEVINGLATEKAVTETILSLCEKIGKIPAPAEDYPGFVSNRILMPMINEAIYTLQEGVADIRSIDSIMKLGMAHPMGPLQLADFIGLDTCLQIMRVLQEGFGQSKYAPCPLLINGAAGS